MDWWPLIYIIIYETHTFKIYTKRGAKYIHQNVPLWPVDYFKIEHNLPALLSFIIIIWGNINTIITLNTFWLLIELASSPFFLGGF